MNGELVKNKAQFEDIKGRSIKQKFEVKLYFIQSKTSDKFDDPEIGGFFDTILDFLTTIPSYPMNQEVKEMIMNYF